LVVFPWGRLRIEKTGVKNRTDNLSLPIIYENRDLSEIKSESPFFFVGNRRRLRQEGSTINRFGKS